MKKSVLIFLAAVLVFVFTACGNGNSEEIQSGGSEDASMPAEEIKNNPEIMKNREKETVDLTLLNSTMVYSEVYNMLVSPEQYIGKTIIIKGQFAVYEGTDNGKLYFACIVADATACCSQGIEFVLEGEYSYPEDYPEIGDEITVRGTFDRYEENGAVYIQLTDAAFEK